MARQKYYAVHNGREGTQIYLTWNEVRLLRLCLPATTHGRPLSGNAGKGECTAPPHSARLVQCAAV